MDLEKLQLQEAWLGFGLGLAKVANPNPNPPNPNPSQEAALLRGVEQKAHTPNP